MKRILVLGPCGSGKSTLARGIGLRLGIPVAHMDAFFWKPGWAESNDAELNPKIQRFIKGKAWVFDGNYNRSLDMRLKRADTVVYLDINKWICRWRVIKRWLVWHGEQRPDMGPGCPEKMDWEFFMWVWNFEGSKTLSKISALGKNHKVYRLRNSGEVKSFLTAMEGAPD